MSINSAFKSANLHLLAFHRDWKVKADQQQVALKAIEDSYDGRALYVTNGTFGRRIAGIGVLDSQDRQEPPEGLRYDRSRSFFVPALRSARGKAIKKEWESLALEKPRYPGMPEIVMSSGNGFQGYLNSPTYFEWEGILYCGWPCNGDYVTGKITEDGVLNEDPARSGYDPGLWDEIRLSEFFAAHESMKDVAEEIRRMAKQKAEAESARG